MLKWIKDKYNSMNLQLKVAFWFTIVGFLSRGISFITTPIFTRVLTTDEYGLFSVFSSWDSVLMVVATLNLHLTVIYNALTKYPDDQQKTVSCFQSLSLCVSVFICSFAILFREQVADLMDVPQTVVVIMFVGFIFIEPYQLWLVYKRYKYDYRNPVIFSIIISLLTPLISLICIFCINGDKGIIRIVSYVLVNTIMPGIIFYFINYSHSKIFFDKKIWGYAAAFAIPLIPHYLADTILNHTDQIMINYFFGTSEVGIYHIAFTVASVIQILTTAINSAYIPWQYQKLQEKDYKKLGLTSYEILGGLFVVILLVILFAPEIIYIFAGETYTGAVSLIPTLVASVFLNYMYQLFVRVEMYCEKKAYTVFATITAAVLNIVLNLLFLPTFGYTFAGISTLIAHIWFVVIHYLFYRRTCKECLDGAKIYDWKILGLISIVLLWVSFLVTISYDFLIIRIGALLLIVIIAVIFRKRIITLIKKVFSNI